MGKNSNKHVKCPECGATITISKVGGKQKKSTDLFDIEEEKEIQDILRMKNIELGKVVNKENYGKY